VQWKSFCAGVWHKRLQRIAAKSSKKEALNTIDNDDHYELESGNISQYPINSVHAKFYLIVPKVYRYQNYIDLKKINQTPHRQLCDSQTGLRKHPQNKKKNTSKSP